MTSRALTLATLLMVCAAVTPEALAAFGPSAPAYAGPAIDGGVRDMAANLPDGGATPAARIDGAAPMPPPLDLAALVDSYATVSRHADGGIVASPASPALRALIEVETAK